MRPTIPATFPKIFGGRQLLIACAGALTASWLALLIWLPLRMLDLM